MLREGENILGRDRGLAAWFESIDVSRQHARISLRQDKQSWRISGAETARSWAVTASRVRVG
jgi:hypothetical protein